jgi:hypothetical protein
MSVPFTVSVPAAHTPPSAYFVVTSPKLHDQWANGDTRLVSWSKGALDGISSFDIEMSQLSTDGLTLIAKNGQCPTARPCVFELTWPQSPQ